jgi:hypothetical protein
MTRLRVSTPLAAWMRFITACRPGSVVIMASKAAVISACV